jgi:PleD family two-component response regulator
MRIKILLLGNDPVSLVADAQLLRERGIMVFSAFNLENVNELITEVKPDLVFFDAHGSNVLITEVYNNMVNGIYFTNIPVIFTLSEDDVYLVTRKRTDSKDKRTII